MKVFFMGTAPFAVESLKALAAAGIEIAAVLTQPDRPRGRGHKLQPSPVKQAAMEMGLEVWQPEKVRDAAEVEKLAALNCDAGCVVAYGQILPAGLLKAPRLGCLNVHASLLPRWRGAAPVHWAVAEGDPETGVAVQQMAEKLDSGPVLLEHRTPVGGKTTAQLLDELAPQGARLLVESLRGLEAGSLKAAEQDESKATYAPLLKKQDGIIDFTAPAEVIARRCRAFSAQPGSRCRLMPEGLELRLYDLETVPGSGQPGSLLGREGGAWIVACGAGAVRIPTVQPAGKRAMGADEFERGHPVGADAVLA